VKGALFTSPTSERVNLKAIDLVVGVAVRTVVRTLDD